MAQLKLKQLDSVLTGSLVVSGSHIITGSLYVSASIFGDGLVLGEEAYSLGANYVGLKTTFQTGSNDYMIISGKSDGSTYISAKDNSGVEIRGGGNRSGNAIVIPDDTFIKLGGSVTTLLRPESDNTTDLGSSTLRYKDLALSGHISSSGNISSSGYIYGDGSQLSGITSGIFQATGSVESATANLQLSGSLLVSGSTLTVRTGTDSGPPTASTAIYTNNITNGYPTSNAWQQGLEGSYFNNFDNTTHVSEILRFVAGIISHSIDTSSPTANTKTFASLDTNENSLGTADSISGYLPTSYTSLTNATLNYLVLKDWTGVGETIFSGLTVYHDNGPTYYVDFDSNSGGSTSVQSSADSELFGLGGLTSGGATRFDVRVMATQSFSDTGSVAAPTTASNTFTTQSYIDYSATSFGTTSGVTLAKIESANPAVIPAAYQDGKFIDVGGTSLSGSLSRKYGSSATDFTSVSASGWYRFHDLKVGIATGSGAYTFVNGTTKNNFWAPVDTIDTAIGLNSIDDSGFAKKELTCVSRSLSGAPYVTGSTYELSSKVTGLFNPMYAASTTLVDFDESSIGFGSVTVTNGTVSTDGGTIQTANAIYDSTGASARSTGTVPYYNDIAIISASVVWDADNDENINQTGTGDTSFQVNVRIRNRESTQSSVKTQGMKYHTQGAFGQHTDSGSMALYGRDQGYDGGALTGTTEVFTGESFRIQLADNVLGFSGTAWVTGSFQLGLGDYDLQVKPGYLVVPGGTYGYWHTGSYASSSAYKFYIRRFQTSGTKTSMTVNLNNNTLVNWKATTNNSVACGLLFKSSASGSGTNSAQSVARIYDPSETTSNLISSSVAHQSDYHLNPFTSAFHLYGNTGGSVGSGTYTVPMRNSDGMYLDSNDNEIYVIVRYKGDPTPLDDITLTFS